jgi:hypothetical protein
MAEAGAVASQGKVIERLRLRLPHKTTAQLRDYLAWCKEAGRLRNDLVQLLRGRCGFSDRAPRGQLGMPEKERGRLVLVLKKGRGGRALVLKKERGGRVLVLGEARWKGVGGGLCTVLYFLWKVTHIAARMCIPGWLKCAAVFTPWNEDARPSTGLWGGCKVRCFRKLQFRTLQGLCLPPYACRLGAGGTVVPGGGWGPSVRVHGRDS